MTVPLEVDPAALAADGADVSGDVMPRVQLCPTTGADGRVVVPTSDQVR